MHCSDGWDRTPQIVSLAQMMLDPYYRSIDGFRTLVEICWLDFGHKMADRNGTANGGADPNERAPIFLQVCIFIYLLIIRRAGRALRYLFSLLCSGNLTGWGKCFIALENLILNKKIENPWLAGRYRNGTYIRIYFNRLV